MDTLVGLGNGDGIYDTLAYLETDKSGGKRLILFSRFYIWTFVAIFTIVAINLLIAIIMSSYEAIKVAHK